MGNLQKNLNIVFRGIQPEMLHILNQKPWRTHQQGMSAFHIDPDTFHGLAHEQYPASSYEEIEGIRRLLEEDMKPVSPQFANGPSVFHLLIRMGQRALRRGGGTLTCRFSELLAWQNVYQKLGQDIFTTAFLAHEDLLYACPQRTSFTWDAVLKTDNVQLNALLQRGIAENHCHLGGTSQNFPLSWACLMNYPHTIRLAAKQIRQNLQANVSRGTSGNVWPWEQRLLWAAYLRVNLFQRLEGIRTGSLNMEQVCFYPALRIRQELDYVRACFGARVPQRTGGNFILDYALRRADCKNGLLENHNRLLSGERSFLYRCFYASLGGTFSAAEQDWFYLYLLLKENFRAEIIQINRQAGFQNFKNYQDRKDSIYEDIKGYRAEAIRLSVNGSQSSQNIVSLEARIAPKDSASQIWRQVFGYEDQIEFAETEKTANQRQGSGSPKPWQFLKNEQKKTGRETGLGHFYVYHFIKSQDIQGPRRCYDQMPPRNHDVRTASRRRAKALGYALQHSSRFCQLVRGIDAANVEIGCRPETFATEFRYLKHLLPLQKTMNFLGPSAQPNIRATYHAGEDFLDIADGIRAIDEAVRFLHLDRGDRIGHGLALGVDPVVHYKFKNQWSVLSKECLLDNLVWLLYRSQELGVPISPKLYSQLKTQADRCFSEIYGDILSVVPLGLYEYYCSMQLRGDAPELYSDKKRGYSLRGSYNSCKKDWGKQLEIYRRSPAIFQLCHCYHFHEDVRHKGEQIEEFHVSKDYMDLIRIMQDRLAEELAEKGIMIECNLTSNYLIGTFRRYDAHPIFRFNNVGLLRTDGVYEPSVQLSVSINTDDSGIFDTSLENEYAILAASLERARTEGQRKYTTSSIYTYLEHIREMGFEQAFQTFGGTYAPSDRFRFD